VWVHFVKFRENTPCTSNGELDFEDDDDLYQECLADHGTQLMFSMCCFRMCLKSRGGLQSDTVLDGLRTSTVSMKPLC